jgi:hypothetical protein
LKGPLLACALGAAATLVGAGSSVPQLVNYQGMLAANTPQQEPVSGTLPMEFRIYGSLAGSDLLWQESWGGVVVEDGVFSVLLGSITPLPAGLFADEATLYLELAVMGETLAPRQRLASVPFAQAADTLDGLDGLDLEESAEIDAHLAAHDADAGAHDAAIAGHDHDDSYYTEGEIDALLPLGAWTLTGDAPDGALRFAHPDAAAPALTLESPAAGGRLGLGIATPAERLDVDGAIRIGDASGDGEGTIRFTGTDFEGRVAGAWKSLAAANVARADVVAFGAVGDGVTDDSAAVLAAIASLAATGGVVWFPPGHYLVTQQLTFPVTQDVSGVATQRPYKLQGAGAFYAPRLEATLAPHAGTILDLRHTAGPKIATHGLGLLETEAITFADLDLTLDDAPFLQTTNTTLHVHDCTFYGRPPGIGLPQSDAIVLGGTSAGPTGSADANAPFQGYGTVIRDNFFSQIRRAVYGRVYANGVVVQGNTVWRTCGSTLEAGAAIEIDGDPENVHPQAAVGWYVAGNLIEITNYRYGIKTRESERNAFIANNFFDPGALTQACYRFETTGSLNYVLAGFHDDSRPFVEDHATGNARSTVVNFHQNQATTFPQETRFLGEVRLESGSAVADGPRLVNLAGDELVDRLVAGGLVVVYTPDGGAPLELWHLRDLGGGVVAADLPAADARLRGGTGPLRVQTWPGTPLELGDRSGLGIAVTDGEVQFSTTGARVLSGVGAPSADAPDGSLYLRSDGGAGSTLYVREAGAWVAK